MPDRMLLDAITAAFAEWERARQDETNAVKRLQAARNRNAPAHEIMSLQAEIKVHHQRCERLLAEATPTLKSMSPRSDESTP